MMSFMREQEPPTTSSRPAAGAAPEGLPPADAAGPQEYLTVAANSKSLRRSTTLVAVLVAVGLVCLLVMIRHSQPQAASATPTGDQTKIEAAIDRLTGVRSEMTARTSEIVNKFYEFSDVVQVRVNELVKNPFEVEGFAKDLKTAGPLDDPRAEAELFRRQRLEQQAKTLKLLSIMRSDRGDCCMINDQILRQGDVLEGFKIARIGSNSVDLLWLPAGTPQTDVSATDEMKVVLKLSE